MSERLPRFRSPTSSRGGRFGDKPGEQGMVRQASRSGVHGALECRPQPRRLQLRPFPGARNTQIIKNLVLLLRLLLGLPGRTTSPKRV
eukprot:3828751-Pyramimonas_sp.AAC.1